MRTSALVAIIALVVPLAALADSPPPRDFSKPPEPDATGKTTPALAEGELAPGTTTLAPIRAGSLTLIPVVATKPAADAENLIVLDEAMDKKLVRIHEIDDDGSVNQLTLTNKSKQPLFLLAGEVIIGGKQDRIIGRNTIIPAKTTLDVPVFCVEHGRWTDGTSKEFKSAKALAHGRLRAKASFEDQSEVWSEVAAKNESRKTRNDTDTYRKVAAQQSDGTLASDEKAVRAALAKLPEADRARMVGYAVAINGSVASVDLFGSPALFKKLEHKLMKSYLTEAVDVAADKKAKAPTVGDVVKFMADADAAAKQASYATDAAETEIQGGVASDKAAVKMKRAKPKAGTPAAADPYADEGDTVFLNYSAK